MHRNPSFIKVLDAFMKPLFFHFCLGTFPAYHATKESRFSSPLASYLCVLPWTVTAGAAKCPFLGYICFFEGGSESIGGARCNGNLCQSAGLKWRLATDGLAGIWINRFYFIKKIALGRCLFGLAFYFKHLNGIQKAATRSFLWERLGIRLLIWNSTLLPSPQECFLAHAWIFRDKHERRAHIYKAATLLNGGKTCE